MSASHDTPTEKDQLYAILEFTPDFPMDEDLAGMREWIWEFAISLRNASHYKDFGITKQVALKCLTLALLDAKITPTTQKELVSEFSIAANNYLS